MAIKTDKKKISVYKAVVGIKISHKSGVPYS